MDMSNIDKELMILAAILKRYLMYPFLAAVAAGSRVFYEYLMKDKMPTPKQIWAILVLTVFSSTATYLIMKDLGIAESRITWVVLLMAFIGHTSLTWLLENWHNFIPKKK